MSHGTDEETPDHGMTPLGELTRFERALRMTLESCNALENEERVSAHQAAGRVLAESVVAAFDIPGFDRSAMDGYAVRAQDTVGAGPNSAVELTRIGVSIAGPQSAREEPLPPIGPGECVEIATGAPLPPEADAIVMVEDTESSGNTISVTKQAASGEHVAPHDEDVSRGQLVLPEASPLTAARVAAASGLGRRRLAVRRKVHVQIVSTGNEVARLPEYETADGSDAPEPPPAGMVYDMNAYGLASMLRGPCFRTGIGPLIRDKLDELKMAITRTPRPDVLILTGGSSVGARDLLPRVVDEVGELIYHGIAIAPGRPTLFGIVRASGSDAASSVGPPQTYVFGLPGFPTSCLVVANQLVVPFVRKLAGLPPRPDTTTVCTLTERVRAKKGFYHVIPVSVENGEATPVMRQSSTITSLTRADGFISMPHDRSEDLHVGDKVTVRPFVRDIS